MVALTVEASAIKLPTVLRQARLHATTVESKAMCLATVARKRKSSRATNAIRKVIYLVTALRAVRTLEALVVADSDLKSVTDAEKSATLRVRAQRPLVEAVAMAEEAMVVLVAVLAAEERLAILVVV